MDSIYHVQTLYIASLIGSIAFALSGYLVGERKQFDIMGVFILAFLTANGGGVARDVLVGRTPAVLLNAEAFWLTTGTIILAIIFKFHRLDNFERRWIFILCDAVGLVAFGITGALIGIEEGTHFFGVIALSFLTATGGGIIRDLLINEVSEILHSGFYGSVALLLGSAIYFLHSLNWLNPASILIAFCLALALRMIAYKRRWRLPKI